jgi:hypothetical protein
MKIRPSSRGFVARLADVQAGRVERIEDFDREFRARHGIPMRLDEDD